MTISLCRRRSPQRRGVALIVMLILLTIVLAAAGLWMAAAARLRDLVQQEEHAVQSQLLAESALRRATLQLRINPGYAGETWTSSGEKPGEAIVRVEAVVDRPQQRRVRVTARFPQGNSLAVATSEQILVQLPGGKTP